MTTRSTLRDIVAVIGRLLVVALASSTIASFAAAREDHDLEYRVKAAFLFNFARFVEWPNVSKNKRTLVIGVLGEDPFGRHLEEAVAGKLVAGKKIEVRRFGDVSESLSADLLFVSASERRRLDEVLRQLEGTAILTVSETDSFLDKGGMINFIVEHGSVRIEVNLDAAREARLDVSSQLLKVARRVLTKDGR